MGNDGIFISTSQPDHAGKITWLKFLEDGSREWYEKTADVWELVKTEAASAAANHTHGSLTGEYEGTFKKIKVENGIVTEFELQ